MSSNKGVIVLFWHHIFSLHLKSIKGTKHAPRRLNFCMGEFIYSSYYVHVVSQGKSVRVKLEIGNLKGACVFQIVLLKNTYFIPEVGVDVFYGSVIRSIGQISIFHFVLGNQVFFPSLGIGYVP
jgi:hypothetical protein